ncbi:U11/U12 small nuclear ribonucleoprotein 48 kDa protein isoform X2 [Nomia melanderi]|uniref:U11/U12 small nuclear ribonucleoprotein 48 kDa protein isoform X2 n=1 Tax=Nomia melanderi TaxID=2448451 RepID=UPI0013044A61|nr:U11/U12 small nuclear ribonucleoprotein 48 kDa protein-like isoform X2 [Nomia melanderi]
MFNCALNHREVQYQSLNRFTKKVHQEIMNITAALDWTVESIEIDNDNRLICPYDSSHRIGKEILDQHLEHCQWKEDGYNEFHIPLSEPSLHSSSPFSIKLDASLQWNIIKEAKQMDPTITVGLGERLVPRTSDRIFTDFTRDERKVLYEYVISHTVKMDVGHDFTDPNALNYQDKNDKKLSFLDLLVQERNLKRRRAKHKGVHTNKKSYTEILKEIIDQQMEFYIDHITDVRKIHCDTKTVDRVNVQSSNKHHGDTVREVPSISFTDFPSSCGDLFLKDPQSYHESMNFHRNSSGTAHSEHLLKDQSKREKYSRAVTELRKSQKQRKHKRSRSKERYYTNKGKKQSTRKTCVKDVAQCNEAEQLNNAGFL